MTHWAVYLLLAYSLLACAKTTGQAIKTAEINIHLATIYLEQGNMARAKQKLLLAKRQAPRFAALYSAYGYFYEMTGNIQQAEVAHRQALSLAKVDGGIQHNYANFLCRQGNWPAAEDYFLKAVADPAYLHVGEIYANAANCAKAAGDMEKFHEYRQQAQYYTFRTYDKRAMLSFPSFAWERKLCCLAT